MFGGPPPPPPPPGAEAAPAAEEGMDLQAKFLMELRDPNRRKKLRKVKAPEPKKDPALEKANAEKSAEQAAAQLEQDRSDLFIEMLGYMEAPGGNVEELSEKCKSATNTARGFIFTLVRRGWFFGFRATDTLDAPGPKGRQPVIVFPGKEWTNGIELRDTTEAELAADYAEDKLMTRVHMYRFDEHHKKHVLDEIALVQGPRFPPKIPPFDEPEPPSNTASLEDRKNHEEWTVRKLKYEHSDSAQFELIFNKLVAIDAILKGTFQQLLDTIVEMRRMGESLRLTFEGYTVRQLRGIVTSIPQKIKEVARQLAKENGIIIRDEQVKLTPDFLAKLNNIVQAPVTATTSTGTAEDSPGRKAEKGSEPPDRNRSMSPSRGTQTTPPPPISTSTSTSTASGPLVDSELLVDLSSPIKTDEELKRRPTRWTLGGVPADVLLDMLKKAHGKSGGGGVVRRMPTI
ncbi:hypothetical protein HDV00_011426 [Rhizophlyctis rosea]|nr:hypothetical protein HDV00_011426 [Rhizophlyctis rosea]